MKQSAMNASFLAAGALFAILIVAAGGRADSAGALAKGEMSSPGATPAVAKESARPRLKVGDRVPGFSLLDQHGKRVRLRDFRGRKLLVYFYPKADSPGCTKQACSVRNHRQDLASLSLAVVGISPDRPEAQKQFDEKYGLGFPLLSDPDHAVALRYAVWGEWPFLARTNTGILRSAFLVNEKGRIAKAWYGVKPDEMVPEVQKALRPEASARALVARDEPIASKSPSALNFTVNDIDGNPVNLSRYLGKVIVMVNVASFCGNTPQYASLQKLYEQHRDRGFVVLAFPANEFGRQEPGTNPQIKEFCQTRYHVTFPVFSKIVVKGEGQHPLYQYLTSKSTNPQFGGDIEWNFAKFLLNRKGEVVARFPAGKDPLKPDVVVAIEQELAKPK